MLLFSVDKHVNSQGPMNGLSRNSVSENCTINFEFNIFFLSALWFRDK